MIGPTVPTFRYAEETRLDEIWASINDETFAEDSACHSSVFDSPDSFSNQSSPISSQPTFNEDLEISQDTGAPYDFNALAASKEDSLDCNCLTKQASLIIRSKCLQKTFRQILDSGKSLLLISDAIASWRAFLGRTRPKRKWRGAWPSFPSGSPAVSSTWWRLVAA